MLDEPRRIGGRELADRPDAECFEPSRSTSDRCR
jgi:hypothetical protein